jgi:two-component sensor histidine kinase
MSGRRPESTAETAYLRRCLEEAGERAERAFALMADIDAARIREVAESRAQADASRERSLEQEVQVLRARLQASEQAAARLRMRCEHQTSMMRELSHRLKNSLTLVQAMISQTLRDPPSLADGRAALLARVVALGQAHRVLVEERWLGTSVRRTVETALATHAGTDAAARFAVTGPAVRLGPRQTVALSMALHELATNATKYGALSCETGRVRIVWHTARGEAGRTLHLCWSEHGGPPVTPPERRGFGSRLIERTLTDTLGGDVVLRFAPDGVTCTMKAVIQRLRET